MTRTVGMLPNLCPDEGICCCTDLYNRWANVRFPEPPNMSNAPKFDDVRMRGFKTRRSVEDVLAWIDETIQSTPTSTEAVQLSQAGGRVLASDLVSELNVPAFRRAMMDGYALHAADTLGATTYNPLPIDIIGHVLPGRSFDEEVQRGKCVSIMTGAPMPPGADAVLPAEKVTRAGEQLSVFDEVPPAKHVGRVGEDIEAGRTVLTRGRRLRAQDLGVISSIGLSEVEVIRRPRVRLVITGNELCAAGTRPEPHQTVDANSPMLSQLIERDGGELLFDGITPDTPEQIRSAMQNPEADVVVVTGGSSVGQEDHAPRILAEIGELSIHGIAMRPSSPTGMGSVPNDDGGRRFVFLLPGNPVSCLCAYDFFAGRAIRLLGSRGFEWPYPQKRGKLIRKLTSVVGRQDYARVLVRWNGETAEVDPIAIAGASVLSSTSRADGFVVIPADSEGYPPDEEIDFYLYDVP